MFRNAIRFHQDISNWDVNENALKNNIFKNSGIELRMDYDQEFATKFGVEHPNPVVIQRKKEKLAIASIQPHYESHEEEQRSYLNEATERLAANKDVLENIGSFAGGSIKNYTYKSKYYITDSINDNLKSSHQNDIAKPIDYKNHQNDTYRSKYYKYNFDSQNSTFDKDYKHLYNKYKMKYLSLKESNMNLIKQNSERFVSNKKI